MTIPRLELQAADLGTSDDHGPSVMDGVKDGAKMDRQHPPPV